MRLLLIAAIAAWCVHLLALLRADRRVIVGSVLVGTVSAAVLLWQWLPLATAPLGAPASDLRWYHLAFTAGVGLPQLAVLVSALRPRRVDQRWPGVAAAAAIAGVAWSIWLALLVFAADAVSVIPTWVGWSVAAIAAVGYWWASTQARSEELVILPLGEHYDENHDAEHEDIDGPGADHDELLPRLTTDHELEDVPAPQALPAPVPDPATAVEIAPAPEPEPEPELSPEPEEPADTDTARKRASAVAVALATQLDKAGRGTAVAVGAARDRRLVFVTADGLGYLPEGGGGASDLVPLITLVPDDFIRAWLGCAHPQMPLLAAEEQGYIPALLAMVTVSADGDLMGIGLEESDESDPAVLELPRGRTDSVPISTAHAALAELRHTWSLDDKETATTQELADLVTAARWTTWPNPDYPSRWIAELASHTTRDFETGNVDAAQYSLASAKRIPPPADSEAVVTPPAQTTQTSPALAPAAPVPLPPMQPQMPQPVAVTRVQPPVPTDTAVEVPARRALSIIATLADQIPGSADIAVALASDGTAVFCTSDGLGYLPSGARASHLVAPLAALVDDEFAAQWLGCVQPHRPLLAAIDYGLIPPATELVTISQDVSDPRVRGLSNAALAAADRLEFTESRDVFAPNTVDIDRVLNSLTARLGLPGLELDAARRQAEALCWTDATDPRYITAWSRYLQVEATAAVEAGDLGAVRYILGNATLVLSAEAKASEESLDTALPPVLNSGAH